MEEILTLLKYLFLGLLQGFTEPIPISSSGHLLMAKELFSIEAGDNLSFEVLVNFGSLIAVLIVYWKDIINIAKNGINYIVTRNKQYIDDFMFIIYLVVATVPAAVIGLLFEDMIAGTFLGKAKMIGISLFITGIALWIIRNIRGDKNDGALTMKDAIIVGLAQAVALIPGISRSGGATIVAAMLLGMKQETALRFSFLMFIPVSAGTMVLSIGDVIQDENFNTLWIPYLIAFIAALIATYYSLRWFMNIMAKGNLKYFAFYCFIVGILAFILL
ncbi:undecaprenyl-diphosphatase [Gracilibacillus boraciitolerans JCM 21714]|uniref:Undecaprenyl-diphosphatase n=1 Tax=Gracilibacillus boraciitolerans JCM 21714 TaxID=1298598 RepID=W4VLF0_9BACI|nr:undecaprenyl-diphosphate phosphatase [Gracilibacillus boraciitolerans]GAE93599.1 undecaprenyl-diphosphatase [Gracilibacillus boraciitolerans JCM 21714]